MNPSEAVNVELGHIRVTEIHVVLVVDLHVAVHVLELQVARHGIRIVSIVRIVRIVDLLVAIVNTLADQTGYFIQHVTRRILVGIILRALGKLQSLIDRVRIRSLYEIGEILADRTVPSSSTSNPWFRTLA